MSAPDETPRDDTAEHDALPPELSALLTSAWHEQPAPEATPSLAQSDAETRAAVDWLQRSWTQLDAPALGEVPRALRRRVAQRRAPVLAWRRHAAAAALLLAVGLALRFSASWSTHVPRADASPPVAARPSVAGGPQLVSAGPGRLELRSGPVRLLLLEPTDSPPLPNVPSLGSDH